MKKILFALMVALLAFTGCVTDSGDDEKDDNGGSGGGGGGTPSEYMPFVQGAKWNFSSTSTSTSEYNSGSYSYTMTCDGTTTLNGKTYWVLTDDEESTYLRIDGNIVYQYQIMDFVGKTAAAKPVLEKIAADAQDLPMFDFGKSSGQTWKIYNYTGSEGGASYTVTMTGKHGGFESVSTPAGSFSNCVKFIMTMTASSKSQEYSFTWNYTQTMWFAKGVGPVKILQTDAEDDYSSTTTDVLTSYSLTGGGGGNTGGSYSITGQIESNTGAGLAGVSVTLTGGTTLTTTTDSGGNYSFSNVANGTYTLTPAKSGYTFSPAYQQVTVSGKNTTVAKFTGTTSGGGGTVTGYDLTGIVQDENGTPIEFVLVVLQDTKNSLNMHAIYTNGKGSYFFDDLTSSTYVLSFDYYGYTFQTIDVTFTGSEITIAPVKGTPSTGGTNAIRGRVVDTFGAGIAGMAVTLSGGSNSDFQVTGAGGYYAFTSVPNGSYTIVPYNENYTFLPIQVTVTVSDADVNVEDIIATPLGSGGNGGNDYYVISGTVLDNQGKPLEWTMVELKGVSLSKDDFGYANSEGKYEINYLKNGTYLLTPSYADYTFTPESATITINGSDITDVNFVATPVSSSGQNGQVIGKLTNGDQLITATLTGTGGTFTADTGYAGSFEFMYVPYGTYTLTFAPQYRYHIYDYSFIPEQTTVVVESPKTNVTGIEYKEEVKPLYQVGGTVTFSSDDKFAAGKGAPNVDIVLTVADGPFAEEAIYFGISTTDGTWKIRDIDGVPNGRYRVYATAGYYSVTNEDFDPKETYVVVENGNVSGVNFVLDRTK